LLRIKLLSLQTSQILGFPEDTELFSLALLSSGKVVSQNFFFFNRASTAHWAPRWIKALGERIDDGELGMAVFPSALR